LGKHFDYSKNMESNPAVASLGALAQNTRLAAYRLLVQAGEEGLCAGDIGTRLDIPAATLSFHLKELLRTGLVTSRQDGRRVIYSASFAVMHSLVDYLSENCCGTDASACAPATGKRRGS
jgi:ArsR family transcriptional regulator